MYVNYKEVLIGAVIGLTAGFVSSTSAVVALVAMMNGTSFFTELCNLINLYI